jgi:hypothetical protein
MPNRQSRLSASKQNTRVEITIEDFDFNESRKENDTPYKNARSLSNHYKHNKISRNLSESPATSSSNLLKPTQETHRQQHPRFAQRRFSFGSTFLVPEFNVLNKLNCRQSSMSNHNDLTEENKIEENVLGRSFEKISVLRNSNNNLKLGSILSATGQCAMLKTYEDEMYKQLKTRFPNKTLCRVGTSKFNSIINSHRQNNNAKNEEEKSVELSARQLKINEHITEAMDILDELSPLNCQKNRYEEYIDMSSKSENETVSRYEKWQIKWANMLNCMF